MKSVSLSIDDLAGILITLERGFPAPPPTVKRFRSIYDSLYKKYQVARAEAIGGANNRSPRYIITPAATDTPAPPSPPESV